MKSFSIVFVYLVAVFHLINGYNINEKQDTFNHINRDADYITEINSPTNYRCDFESGLCNFLQNDRNNYKNWRLGKGSTIDGISGPFYDHTSRTDEGTFLYADANNDNDTKLNTVILRGEYCIRFFYHMHISNSEVKVVAQQSDENYSIETFVKRTQQEDRWVEAMFSFTPTKVMKYKGYQLAFIAKGRAKTKEYIAIDDVELTSGTCKSSKGDAYKLCTFDEDDCGYSGQHAWFWNNPIRVNKPHSNLPEDHTLGTNSGGYWYNQNGYRSGVHTSWLKSPAYDKPKRSFNCLRFYFYLRKIHSSKWPIYVSVNLNYPNISDSRKWIVTKGMNNTNLREWNYVESQVDIIDSFQLEFEAYFHEAEMVAAVDDIIFTEGNCDDSEIPGTMASSPGTSVTSPRTSVTSPGTSTSSPRTKITTPGTTKTSPGTTITSPGTTITSPGTTITSPGTSVTSPGTSASSPRTNTTSPRTNITLPSTSVTYDFETTTKGFECDCGPNATSCKIDTYGRKNCLCKQGFYQLGDMCKDCNCGRNSTGCNYELGVKKCLCNTGFSQRNETCRMTCTDDRDCLNDGKCIIHSSSKSCNCTKSIKFCNCTNEYSGDRCDVFSDLCDQLESVCNRFHAICRLIQGKAVCECPPEKVYRPQSGMCENICNERTCLNGRCEIVGRKHKCKCDEGYSGDACDVIITPLDDDQNYMKIFTILASLVISIFVFIVGFCCIGVICGLRRNRKG